MLQGHRTFKTWWGAFFTLLAIGTIGYYAYLKGNFYYYNHSTHFITRLTVVDDHQLEDARHIHTLAEQEGRALLADLRTRGINLLPSEKQLSYLQRMLESADLTQEEAVESANLRLAGAELNRDEASALIDHLSTLQSEGLAPSAKQLHLIAKLADKAGLDEAGASALVGVVSYAELTGGRSGTASAAIDALRAV